MLWIRNQEGKNDPQKLNCWMISFEGRKLFNSCSLEVLYGDLGISKLQFFKIKIWVFLAACFFNIWSSKLWIRIDAFKPMWNCGFTTLLSVPDLAGCFRLKCHLCVIWPKIRQAGNTDLHAASIGRLQLQQRLRQRRVDERVVHVSKHLHQGHN